MVAPARVVPTGHNARQALAAPTSSAPVAVSSANASAGDAGHLALPGLDEPRCEAMVVRTAWRRRGHALSPARATPADVPTAPHLLSQTIAPRGVRLAEFVTAAGTGA